MPATASSYRLLLATYVAAIFVSAALLFAVQPLFAKMVLPRLGGTPAVWSVAMVFFQAMLLAGYAYAHALTRFLPGKASVVVHIVVMIVAVFCAAARHRGGLGQGAGRQCQEFWLLGLFAASIGIAVLRAVGERSAAAGLVRAHRPSAGQGSILPLRRKQYRQLPRAAGLSLRDRAVQPSAAADHGMDLRLLSPDRSDRGFARPGCCVRPTCLPNIATDDGAPPTWRDALIWIALAAVPSALLIAITAHISTDVAAAPFLWVVPLALYLATFVIAFQTRPILPHRLITFIAPGAVILLVVSLALGSADQILVLIAHQSGGLLRAGADVPRRARQAPPACALSDFVLSVPVARRRDRRHFCRPDRAAHLLLGCRISASDHRSRPCAGPDSSGRATSSTSRHGCWSSRSRSRF